MLLTDSVQVNFSSVTTGLLQTTMSSVTGLTIIYLATGWHYAKYNYSTKIQTITLRKLITYAETI